MDANDINITTHKFLQILFQANQLKHIWWHLDTYIYITRLTLLIAGKWTEQAKRAYIKLLDDGLCIRLDSVNTFLSCYHSVRKDRKFSRNIQKNIEKSKIIRIFVRQLARRSAIPRHKVIAILARLVRFHVVQWEYVDQEFLFVLL